MKPNSSPDLATVYLVLRRWAIKGEPRSYTDLSNDYCQLTQTWFEPHGSWDLVLGELNQVLASMGAPALSALVCVKETGEPGAGFWGCVPNLPRRPKNILERTDVWMAELERINLYQWPDRLTG